MIGTQVGHYKLVRLLGEGGMGAVYEGVHQKLRTHVAIKLLHREHAANSMQLSRFFNEARAVNLIDHPALVAISDVGQLADGSAYLVMELLSGESLSQYLKRRQGRLPEVEALQITWQLASALDATHKKNIVHRDLKPGNVMLVHDASMGNTVRLVDFGIAKLSGLDPDQPSTHTGAFLGTHFYMSPEQCRGAKVDGKADVYSLGVMIYQLIAGRLPFNAETPIGVISMHLVEPVPVLAHGAPHVSPALSQLVFRMMSKDKEARPTMAELLTQLEQINPTLATARLRLLAPRASAPEPERDPLTTAGSSLGQAIAERPPKRRRSVGLLLGGALVALSGLGIWASRGLHPTTNQGAGIHQSLQSRAAPPPAPVLPSAAPLSATPSPQAGSPAAATESAAGPHGLAHGKSRLSKAAKKPASHAKGTPAARPSAKRIKTVIID